jgi:hypothetical protein
VAGHSGPRCPPLPLAAACGAWGPDTPQVHSKRRHTVTLTDAHLGAAGGGGARQPQHGPLSGRLLDGNHTGQQLFNGTPGTLQQLLTRRGIHLLRHPSGALAAELATDDSVCTNWSPATPTRLYYATRDEQAVNANTFHCQAGFAARGARIPVVSLGTPNHQGSRHFGSNMAGTAQIVRWFSQLAQHGPSARHPAG